jgi:hypothetical protein
MTFPTRPAFMAILEFAERPAFPIPADSLAEAEGIAVQAASELAGLVRVPVYRYGGPGEEYRLIQTLEIAA